MEVERKIRKIGNSLGVILPSDMLKQIDAAEGDSVYVEMKEDQIIIRRHPKSTTNDPDQEFEQKVISIVEKYLQNR